LESLLARTGFTDWVNELRSLLRHDGGGGPLDSQRDVRSEHPQSPPTESNMPKKAKSQKTARPQRAKSPRSAAKPATRKTAAKRTGASRTATTESVKRLVAALQSHPRQKDLISAGQEKDQLLRSLIPLYLARTAGVEVTSGTTSRFWSKLGVSYAAPNAAKALRIHTGYASETKKGKTITAKGVRYVEDAISRG
jgi:hypothetical protein